MDLLTAPEGNRTDSREGKKARMGGTDKELAKFQDNLACMGLNSQLMDRVFRACVLDTYTLVQEHPYVTESRKATKDFADGVKGLSASERKQKFGEPHAHVFNAWVKVAIRYVTDEKDKQRLRAWTDQMKNEGGVHGIMKYVRHARVSRPKHSRSDNIECNVKETIVRFNQDKDHTKEDLGLEVLPCPTYGVWLIIQKSLVDHAKAEYRQGLAPAGDLERKVQNYVNQSRGLPPRYNTRRDEEDEDLFG